MPRIKNLFFRFCACILLFLMLVLPALTFTERNITNAQEDDTFPQCLMGPGNCGCYLSTSDCYTEWRVYGPENCDPGTVIWIADIGKHDHFQNGIRFYYPGYVVTTCLATAPPDMQPFCIEQNTCG